MPNELYEIKIKSIGYTDDVEIREEPKKVAGKNLGRKTVGSDKIINVSSVEDNSITQAMLQDAVVGKAELRYEQVSITISDKFKSNEIHIKKMVQASKVAYGDVLSVDRI